MACWVGSVSSYGLPGQLGVSNLPGCRFGEVWRKLKPDVDDLKQSGFTDMFLLCTKGELVHYRVPCLLSEYAAAGFGIHHYPIEDDIETSKILEILKRLRDILSSGKKLDPGMSSETAIEKLQELRGHKAIETVKQYNFVNDFRRLSEEYQDTIQGDGEPRSVSR